MIKKRGVNLKKRQSRIHGQGIFADQLIHSGDSFYQVPLTSVFAYPKSGCARIAEGKYVNDAQVLNFVNHSCNPTAKLDLTNDPILVAVTDIAQGVEITVDYNETEIDGKMCPCSCGSKKCRGYFVREI